MKSKVWLAVLIPLAIYVVLRLPILVHAPGGQDEQWFAVPGWTVWNEGVPRIPYVPTRNRSTFFEDADVCLMTLPPALFYVQAPFHAFFQPGYPTSRLPLFFGALAAIVITFVVARKLGSSVWAAGLVAVLMALGRPLMFTGLMVRPDLLSALFGWLCGWFLWQHFETKSSRTLCTAGFCCGLAGLFHPFALVFAMQAGVAMLVPKDSLAQRAKRLVVFGVCCAAAIALWLPLILKFPEPFRSQFFSNVLDRAGPGLPSRIFWPWPSIHHHATLLYEFAGPWQCGLFALATIATTFCVWKSRPRGEAIGYIALLWSSLYLTAVVAGLHPTKGYWVYPCLWLLAGFAVAIDRMVFANGVNGSQFKPSVIRYAIAVCLLVALMLPGAGLRSTHLYLTHWGDQEFHGRRFIADVLDEMPKDGLFMADLPYVYDLYLSGRETLLLQNREQYWSDRELDNVTILQAWEGDDLEWASQYDAAFVKRYGSREIPQTCFVDLYRSTGKNNE
ncbi:MAG: glycosyltransferase family 39 protein [Pirellulaceae bacterium]